ncbi:Gfo/Idh/MocA family protein [Paenibacillus caui]|uniref:Gfo/Idh/MocA family protein n=1 Tax=Paenibacillus caui TaxID=2873927 RepID=UPI001CA84425|nr:Gfo/Idh/MocA family oxidoreductase [Paenibacillus caui]
MVKPKLRWGVIGCASIAQECVMPAIRKSETGILAALASRSLKKSKDIAEQFGVEKAYGSYGELLSDPDIDAVYIPLPNHLHCEWSIAAAQAGKHVLCEKPAALNAGEAAAMVNAAHNADVKFAEALMYRHHPQLKEIRERIQAGIIGELRLIRASFTCSSVSQTGNIRFHKETGGGALYDLGEYPLSAARWMTGTEPYAVTVYAQYSKAHGGVDMMASGLVEFPGGLSLLFDCGLWAEERRSIELVGSKGRIVMPFAFSGMEQSGYELYRDGEQVESRELPMNAYVLEIDHFGKSVLEGKPLDFPPEDAVANLRLLDACRRSALENRRVVLS